MKKPSSADCKFSAQKLFKHPLSNSNMKLGRKITGGKYHHQKKKKLYEKKGQEKIVMLRETKRKQLRTRGGNAKKILLSANIANIYDPKSRKTQKAEIKNVLETPQNVFLARQNLLSKGAIIQTSLGKAKITNRPTREGMINAVLLKD